MEGIFWRKFLFCWDPFPQVTNYTFSVLQVSAKKIKQNTNAEFHDLAVFTEEGYARKEFPTMQYQTVFDSRNYEHRELFEPSYVPSKKTAEEVAPPAIGIAEKDRKPTLQMLLLAAKQPLVVQLRIPQKTIMQGDGVTFWCSKKSTV